jgi:MFS family permease
MGAPSESTPVAPPRETTGSHDFSKLWMAQTVSLLGTQVTYIALPLTAITLLGAGPLQTGLLGAVQYLPFLLFGLVVGVIVDRTSRRRVLIAADLARFAVLALVPLTAALHVLRMELLLAIAFATGCMTVFFDVAYQAYLPSLVTREGLGAANARLEVSRSVAQTVGPGLGGALVQALTAATAVLADALSYAGSALLLLLIRRPEPASTAAAGSSLLAGLHEGLAFLLRHRVLRSIMASTATANVFIPAMFSLYVLYLTRDLHLAPLLIGVVVALSGVGGVVGATVATRLAQRLGLRPALMVGLALAGAGMLFGPAARLAPGLALPVLAAGELLFGAGLPIYNVNQVTYRQAAVPMELQGRVHAANRVVIWSAIPLGSLIGGTLGSLLGLPPALVITGLGTAASAVWLLGVDAREPGAA